MNSKAKGNAFERTIANRLSERFTSATGLTSAFRRATDSGAYFGKSNARRLLATGADQASFGDIITPRNFRFTIEAKAYREPPTLSALLKQHCALLDNWISQANADAENAGKLPALIVKWNHCPAIVLLDDGFNIEELLRYKDRVAVTLDDWLTMPDDHFFMATE